MHFFRSVYHHSFFRSVQSFFAQIKIGMGKTGHGEPDKVCHGSSAYHQPACLSGKTKKGFEPLDHLCFNQSSCLVTSTLVEVNSRSKHIGHHCKGSPVSHHPSPEPRMNVSGRVWKNIFFECVINFSRR